MKILLIGNSYTYYNDMPSILLAFGEANGKEISVRSITAGGRKLYQNVSAEDAMAKEIALLPTEEGAYDVCILQENSTYAIGHKPLFMDGVKGHVELLKPVVSRFLLYETWGRKEGSSTLTDNGWTNKSMTEGIAEAYQEAAILYAAEVSPVGEVFYDCYTTHPEIELYHPDKSHPSYQGSVLAAMVHYRTIFGEAPKKIPSLQLSENEVNTFLSLLDRDELGGKG